MSAVSVALCLAASNPHVQAFVPIRLSVGVSQSCHGSGGGNNYSHRHRHGHRDFHVNSKPTSSWAQDPNNPNSPNYQPPDGTMPTPMPMKTSDVQGQGDHSFAWDELPPKSHGPPKIHRTPEALVPPDGSAGKMGVGGFKERPNPKFRKVQEQLQQQYRNIAIRAPRTRTSSNSNTPTTYRGKEPFQIIIGGMDERQQKIQELQQQQQQHQQKQKQKQRQNQNQNQNDDMDGDSLYEPNFGYYAETPAEAQARQFAQQDFLYEPQPMTAEEAAFLRGQEEARRRAEQEERRRIEQQLREDLRLEQLALAARRGEKKSDVDSNGNKNNKNKNYAGNKKIYMGPLRYTENEISLFLLQIMVALETTMIPHSTSCWTKLGVEVKLMPKNEPSCINNDKPNKPILMRLSGNDWNKPNDEVQKHINVSS